MGEQRRPAIYDGGHQGDSKVCLWYHYNFITERIENFTKKVLEFSVALTFPDKKTYSNITKKDMMSQNY